VTSAPYQHLSFYVFRSIETGRWLARAANTGVSAFIDPYGAIRSRTPIFTEGLLVEDVPLLSGQTIYNRYGDLFAYVCCAGAVLFILFAFVIRRAGVAR
jgi:apolipoprotein N-acyltransferase